ncbi:MAG: 50S ribosomal protein L28 [Dehalococcoidales bacterium]
MLGIRKPFLSRPPWLCYHLYWHFILYYLPRQRSTYSAVKCELCGKTPQFGHNISHSKRHTKRNWKPNIHPATVMRDGRQIKLKLCTRCLRTQKKLVRAA